MQQIITTHQHGVTPNNLERNNLGADKISLFGWTLKDAPGTFLAIDKREIRVAPEYQREANTAKVTGIASCWSWVAFVAIPVSKRDGMYYAIDGQHRVLAALRRSDITVLPCMVFEALDVVGEANGFLAANTYRKPITIFDRLKAMSVAKTGGAAQALAVLAAYSISINKSAKSGMQTRAVGWCLKAHAADEDAFELAVSVAAGLSYVSGLPIQEALLSALWYLDRNIEGGVSSRMQKRISQVGHAALNMGMAKAASYHGSGGEKVYATGLLDTLNKGLRQKWALAAA